MQNLIKSDKLKPGQIWPDLIKLVLIKLKNRGANFEIFEPLI